MGDTTATAAEIAAEVMTIMPLGGGQEVGRSCILLQYQGRNVLLDCGCHPGREGMDSLPFFDSLESNGSCNGPEDIDLVLITHFHIDHCAALPYFTEKTNFRGRVFMTHPTKAVMKLLLADNIKLQYKSTPLYTEQDLQNCIDKIEVVDYHETVEHRGVKFTASAAGHVLGAAMFMIDIDSIRVLYTGDYSLEEDRHLIQAEVPAGGPPDVLIVESTFGVTNIPPREKREKEFTRTVANIVARGGSCLIPVFALGRAQELLLILDEYWRDNEDLQSVPIFYASKLASKSLRVYQTFINMMNTHIRHLMDQFHNPFKLTHIRSIQQSESEFALLGPCVVMASPGFLQSGVSRHLFEQWCDEERNGVVLAGYTIEGTLAGDLLSYPTEIKCLDNRIKPRRCQIEYITFSAHVDFTQNKTFMKRVQPDYIILVHGEKTNMRRLKEGLESEMRHGKWFSEEKESDTVNYAQQQQQQQQQQQRHLPSIATPENGTKVRLRFFKTIVAEAVGSAATALLSNNNNKNPDTRTAAAAEKNATTLIENPTLAPMIDSLDASESQFEYFQGRKDINGVKLPKSSILVTENFNSKLVAAEELANYTNCKFGKITQRMMIPVPVGFLPVLFQGMGQRETEESQENSLSPLMEYVENALFDVFDRVDHIFDTKNVQERMTSTGYLGRNILKIENLVLVREGFPLSVLAECPSINNNKNNSNKIKKKSAVSDDNLEVEVEVELDAGLVSHLEVEWSASPSSDTVAECVVSLLLQQFSTMNMLRLSMKQQQQQQQQHYTRHTQRATEREGASSALALARARRGVGAATAGRTTTTAMETGTGNTQKTADSTPNSGDLAAAKKRKLGLLGQPRIGTV